MPAQIIGTYNSEDHTWLWAWANSSIEEKLQADARQLLKYGEENHIDRLTNASGSVLKTTPGLWQRWQ